MSAIPAFEPELVMTEAEYLAFEEASDTKHGSPAQTAGRLG